MRSYSATLGRWLTPDPAGLRPGLSPAGLSPGLSSVDLTNPQSWNRYAYVLNNPVSHLDPLGLQCSNPSGSTSQRQQEACFFNDGDLATAYNSYAANMGVAYSVKFGGAKPVIFGSFDAMASAVTSYEALPNAFLKVVQNNGLDKNSSYTLKSFEKGFAVTVQFSPNIPLDTTAAGRDGWKDPVGKEFDGASSWYVGNVFFNTTHLIEGTPDDPGAAAHIDPFGPFNPMHLLFQVIPGAVFGKTDLGNINCRVGVGCH